MPDSEFESLFDAGEEGGHSPPPRAAEPPQAPAAPVEPRPPPPRRATEQLAPMQPEHALVLFEPLAERGRRRRGRPPGTRGNLAQRAALRRQRERAQAAGPGSRTEQAARAAGRKRAAHAHACKQAKRMRMQDPAASLIVLLRPFGSRLHRDLVGAAVRRTIQRSPRWEELASQLCGERPRLVISNTAEAEYLACRRQTLANDIVDLAAMVHFSCRSFAASSCSWLLRMISDNSMVPVCATTYHLFDETPMQTRATAPKNAAETKNIVRPGGLNVVQGRARYLGRHAMQGRALHPHPDALDDASDLVGPWHRRGGEGDLAARLRGRLAGVCAVQVQGRRRADPQRCRQLQLALFRSHEGGGRRAAVALESGMRGAFLAQLDRQRIGNHQSVRVRAHRLDLVAAAGRMHGETPRGDRGRLVLQRARPQGSRTQAGGATHDSLCLGATEAGKCRRLQLGTLLNGDWASDVVDYFCLEESPDMSQWARHAAQALYPSKTPVFSHNR